MFQQQSQLYYGAKYGACSPTHMTLGQPFNLLQKWGARSHTTTWQTRSEARSPHAHALRPAHLQGTQGPMFLQPAKSKQPQESMWVSTCSALIAPGEAVVSLQVMF